MHLHEIHLLIFEAFHDLLVSSLTLADPFLPLMVAIEIKEENLITLVPGAKEVRRGHWIP